MEGVASMRGLWKEVLLRLWHVGVVAPLLLSGSVAFGQTTDREYHYMQQPRYELPSYHLVPGNEQQDVESQVEHNSQYLKENQDWIDRGRLYGANPFWPSWRE
tara:strand:+ start:2626 stop:2934 length:309 start_codon:yes stop_codon:yes gene_type:complete